MKTYSKVKGVFYFEELHVFPINCFSEKKYAEFIIILCSTSFFLTFYFCVFEKIMQCFVYLN